MTPLRSTPRRLIVEEFVSVDGVAADEARGTDVFAEAAPPDGDDAREQLAFLREGIDTILLGAETYRLFSGYWPTPESRGELVADWINDTPKVVVSSTLDDAPWGDHAPARVLRGDAASAVAALKAEDGKGIVVWGSLVLAGSLLAAGLVDELRLRVVPVLLGSGRRLCDHDGGGVPLELLEARASSASGVVSQRYAVGVGQRVP